MIITVKQSYKSIHVAQSFELPDFVVLTGKNGSGKSHLMELMIMPNNCQVTDAGGRNLSQIKYIPFNGLNPHVDEICEYLGLTNNRKQAGKHGDGFLFHK